MSRSPTREIDIIIDQPLDIEASEDWLNMVMQQALRVALADDKAGQVSLLLTDDAAVRADTSTTSFVAPSGAAAAAPLELLASSTDVDVAQRSPIVRFDEASRLRLALLGRKREVLLRLRREGTIDDLVARRLQSGLDLEELRLDGARAPR